VSGHAGTAVCDYCHPPQVIPLEDLAVHVYVEHGETLDGWPDGAPVVVDATLEPGDFR
jgi:hypothetical protein